MTTFKVTVIDSLSRQPVPKALVFLIPGTPLGGSPRRTTPASGEVTFYDGPPILNQKDFDVIVIAPGYYPGNASGTFSLHSVDLTIEIEPAEQFQALLDKTAEAAVTEAGLRPDALLPGQPAANSNVRIPPR